MKILAANKFYHIHGGSDRYFFELNKLLEMEGHQVVPFAMQHPKNEPCSYSRYFTSQVDYFGGNMSLLRKIKAAVDVIYNLEARRKMEALVSNERPRIAHLHIICHQLSPSILPPMKRAGVKVVQTMHEYKAVCPTYRMIAHERICERCKPRRYYQAVLQRCNRGSLAASMVNAMEMYVHKFLGIYEKNVDLFIAPSVFMKNKTLEFGFKPKQMIVLPYFIDLQAYQPRYDNDGYFIFFGRLVKLKGVMTLLQAMAKLRQDSFKLKILGEGEMLKPMQDFCERNGVSTVEFLGFKGGEELKEIVRGAMFSVVPSEWYDNYPLSVMESLALGVPVIGANLGGIPEMIEDGVDGLIHRSGDADDLSDKIQRLIDRREQLPEMGKAAREKVARRYDHNVHYRKIMAIYDDLLNDRPVEQPALD